MPSLHLPLAPCDKFGYDFYVFFSDNVGGYGLRHMCLYYVRSSCNSCCLQFGARPYGGCAEVVRNSCNFSAAAVQSSQAFHESRTEPVRLPCRGCEKMIRCLLLHD